MSDAERNSSVNVLVLGMHRSGTSAVAAVLREAGLYTGAAEELEPAGPANPDGYLERRDVVALNERFLAALGWQWDVIPPAPLTSPLPLAQLVSEGRDLVRDQLAGHRAWLIKDPRMCVLLPWWREILLDRFVAVVALRSANEVAWSLAVRNGFPVPLGSALWLSYYRHLAGGLSGVPAIVVDYGALAENPGDVVPLLLDQLTRAGVSGSLDGAAGSAAVRAELRRDTIPSASKLTGEALKRTTAAWDVFLPQAPVSYFDRLDVQLAAVNDSEAAILDIHAGDRATAANELGAAQAAIAHWRIAADRSMAELARVRTQLAATTSELARVRGELSAAEREVREDQQRVEVLRVDIAQVSNQLALRQQEISLGQQELAHSKEDLALSQRELAARDRQLAAPLPPPARGVRVAVRRLRDRLPAYLRTNSLFDRDWYRTRYPDAAASRLPAAWHYHRHGRHEDRDPNAFLDADWYLQRYPDVATTGMSVIDHYLRFGGYEGRDPGPDFDARRYLRENPDVAAAGLNPLVHYLRHGRREGRPAHALDGQTHPLEPVSALAPAVAPSPPVDGSIANAPSAERTPASGWDTDGVLAADSGLVFVPRAGERLTMRLNLPAEPPTTGRAGIVQMEAARWAGADKLLISPTAGWWIERVPEFSAHLQRWYRHTSQSDGTEQGWDLSEPSVWAPVHELFARLAAQTTAVPSMLVWRSERNLNDMFPDCRVFRPGADTIPLPYLERSIDVVAVGDTTGGVLDEARRLARTAVVDVSGEVPRVVWESAPSGAAAAPASIALLAMEGASPGERWARLFAQAVDLEIANRPIVVEAGPIDQLGRIDAAVERESADVIVVVEAGLAVVPGSLAALVTLSRSVGHPGVVSGALVDVAGRWLRSPDVPVGAAGVDVGLPPYDVTEAVPFGSLRLAAIRRDEYVAARAETRSAGLRGGAGLGEALKRTGARWLSTTDAIAIAGD